MIEFPESTRVHRRIPKEAFYQNMELSSALKEKFVSDVDRVFVENSLSAESLRLTKDSEIKEILLIMVALKKKDYDSKILEAIARQIPYRIVFLIAFEGEAQLALYQRKLYKTPWNKEENLTLTAEGFSLNEIWDGFVEKIALQESAVPEKSELTTEEKLALQARIEKLEKLVQKAEAAAWKEQQPKKRFTLYTQLNEYKRELEDLKRG